MPKTQLVETLLKRCRRNGGDCECGYICKAEKLLLDRLGELAAESIVLRSATSRVANQLAHLRRVHATVKPGGNGSGSMWCE